MFSSSVLNQRTISDKEKSSLFQEEGKGHIYLAALLLFLIEISVIVWNYFDHSLPYWDTASHRLNSLSAYHLLTHAHFRSIDWYRHLLGISSLYPPLVYIINGLLKLIVGWSTDTEVFVNLVFVALLFSSVYYAAYVTSKNKLAAPIAATLVFMYPRLYWSAHHVLLDFPAVAMTGVSLATFLWWAQKPATAKSVLLGIILGLTVLTKNNTPIFLVGPFFVDGIISVYKRDLYRIKQLAITTLFSVLILLPWLILSLATVGQSIASIQLHQLGPHTTLSFLETFSLAWSCDLPYILSPILFYCFIASLFTQRNLTRNKIYLIAFGLGGILIASNFRWWHSFRYIVPAAIPMAIVSADMFARAWSTRLVALRIAAVALGFVAVFQFIYAAFTPYPLRLPDWISKTIASHSWGLDLPDELGPNNLNADGPSFRPLPYADWGTSWVLSTIKEKTIGKAPSMIIMPNSESVNVSTYVYLAHVKMISIAFVNCREFTTSGDTLQFDRKRAQAIDWYVLKTGDQGLVFSDKASAAQYDQWCQYVRLSKIFQLVGTKLLPDGSTLQLYKNTTSQK